MDSSQIGKRAWSYAGVLQDAGPSCFEYVEQLTLLLFLKMADQLTEPPYSRQPIVPPKLGWKALLPLDGAADTDALPPPAVLASEIADDLEAALEQFTKIASRLSKVPLG